MDSTPELIITNDGSHTVYLGDLDEHYHSKFGAVTESRHVFIEAGLKTVPRKNLRIFEMGFGTGLNAFLTLLDIHYTGQRVHYTAIEKHPLDAEIIDQLNYPSAKESKQREYLNLLHAATWNEDNKISRNFTIHKIEADMLDASIPGPFDLVYFDAFAPDKQPELWTTVVFSKIYHQMRSDSILVTYSSRGQVRRDLEAAGFRVEKLAGPPGKRDMTRAWKD
jgi:tRNA U34 5-methylaminomethyl-2-thiouridine-forming methyltransferase MnmC